MDRTFFCLPYHFSANAAIAAIHSVGHELLLLPLFPFPLELVLVTRTVLDTSIKVSKSRVLSNESIIRIVTTTFKSLWNSSKGNLFLHGHHFVTQFLPAQDKVSKVLELFLELFVPKVSNQALEFLQH